MAQLFAQPLDGKKVAEAVFSKLVLDISLLPVVPKLALILVGEDPASQTYVKSKGKRSQELGILSETILLPATTTEAELLGHIDRLNKDKSVHGILIQLPLPAHINKYKVLTALNPLKDVDGLHVENIGLLTLGKPRFVPCTPAGVIEILSHYQIPMSGKHAVVLGRSEIVGKPMAQLLLMQDATVTTCHSKSVGISDIARTADILVVAIGKHHIVDEKWVKSGATVIDVGIHRVNGVIQGDVNFASVDKVAGHLTPVPGGVGPMTIAMLMRNVVTAAKLQLQ